MRKFKTNEKAFLNISLKSFEFIQLNDDDICDMLFKE